MSYKLFCDFCGKEIKKMEVGCFYQIESIKYQYTSNIGEYSEPRYCCEICFKGIKIKR